MPAVVVFDPGAVVVGHEVDVPARLAVGRGGLLVVAHPADAMLVVGRVVPSGEYYLGERRVPVGERGLVGSHPVARPVDRVQVHGGCDVGNLGAMDKVLVDGGIGQFGDEAALPVAADAPGEQRVEGGVRMR